MYMKLLLCSAALSNRPQLPADPPDWSPARVVLWCRSGLPRFCPHCRFCRITDGDGVLFCSVRRDGEEGTGTLRLCAPEYGGAHAKQGRVAVPYGWDLAGL